MLRLRDLLDEFGLEVLAGEGALDTEVRGVQVSDLLDPTPWLSQGELLLTNGAQLDRPRGFDNYLARLAAKNVAGLGIARQVRASGPPQSVAGDLTDGVCLPLLSVPPTVPFIALAHAVSSRIQSDREDRLARTLAFQDALEEETKARSGIVPLVTALAGALGAVVLLCDCDGRPLVTSDGRNGVDSKFLAALGAEIRAREAEPVLGTLRVSTRGHGLTATGLPVSWDRGAVAAPGDFELRSRVWLVVVREPCGSDDEDLLAIRQAVPLVALELLRHRVTRNRQRQLASEALTAIAHGAESPDEVERRLAAYDLTDDVAAIVVRTPETPGWSVARTESVLSMGLRHESAPGLVASSGPLAVALIPGLPDDELFALAERVGIGIASSAGSSVWLGVGRGVRAREAGKSVDEARLALEAKATATTDSVTPAGGSTVPTTRIGTFKDLGSYQLLLGLQNHDALRRFCDSILGPIEAMDTDYGGELLRSLQVFIETNGQWERAARQLFCHRHTLRYRIRKVEELTGRDLESATDRIDLYLALRARAMLP